MARHAHATRVGLTVSYMENEVALDVRDDGVGFDPATVPEGGGFGLIAMRQRIADLSGTVEVESEPGGGTAISTCVPTVVRPGGRVTAPPIRVLIADDHPVVRDGLSGMFAADPDFAVVGEAADGSEALRLAQVAKPDVILMDLRMPGMDGVTAIAELSRRGSPARVLVLTTYDTDSYVLPAIEAGATGYLLKDAPRAELLRAVRAAAQGQSVLAPSVATRLMSRVRTPEPEILSQRELEVLGLVAAGTHQPGGRGQAVHQRGDGEDPPAAHLRQARRDRPRLRGGRGLQPRPAHPGKARSLVAARHPQRSGAYPHALNNLSTYRQQLRHKLSTGRTARLTNLLPTPPATASLRLPPKPSRMSDARPKIRV